jgi:undecaprenyl-phosphate 4-deoxy-4-formamido-L-arabinose transferase
MDYSIVVPVHNSAATLWQLHGEIQDALVSSPYTFELILVNDASSDDSWGVIKEIKAATAIKVVAINLAENVGQHRALFCGFRYATGRFVITLDDDLQFAPKDIMLLIERQRLTGADMVYGSLKKRKHSVIRNISSRIAVFLFSIAIPGIHLKGTSFRLISAGITSAIKNSSQHHIFIDGLMAPHVTNIQTINVSHNDRKIGHSGHSVGKQLIWALQSLFIYSTSVKVITGFSLVVLFLFAILWHKLPVENSLGAVGWVPGLTTIVLLFFCIISIVGWIWVLNNKWKRQFGFLIKEVLV